MKSQNLFLAIVTLIALAGTAYFINDIFTDGKSTFFSCSPGGNIASCVSGAASCTAPGTVVMKPLSEYSEDDQKLISYIAGRIMENDGDIAAISEEIVSGEIARATGLNLSGKDESYYSGLQGGILTALSDKGADLEQLIAKSNCAKFAACSVDMNLVAASGDELERYALEKAEDGKYYTGWQAPDFLFNSMDGASHSLADYRGKKVALMLFAIHCKHCYETIPLIAGLNNQFGSSDLTIIPVYVNKTGRVSTETLKVLEKEFNIDYELMISQHDNISELFQARMVPSTFLIDENGYINRKLVGQKDELALAEAFDEFINSI